MLKNKGILFYSILCVLGIVVGWGANDILTYVEAFFPGSPGIRVIQGGRYYAKTGGYGIMFSNSRQRMSAHDISLGVIALKDQGRQPWFPNDVDIHFDAHFEGFGVPTIELDYWFHERTVFLTDVGMKGRWLIKTVTTPTGMKTLVRLGHHWVTGGLLDPPYFNYGTKRYRYNDATGDWNEKR